MAVILVVDDSAVDRRIVRGILERVVDYEVLEALDGVDALEKVDERSPDVVITDLLMPRCDGFELVAALKDDHPAVPVILMTGRGSEGIAAKALQQGAASYVPKVRLAEELLPTVLRVLAASNEDRTHSRVLHHMHECTLRFRLMNDLSLLRSAVNLLQLMLRSLPLGDEIERVRVGIAVEEALKNAYFHGNLEIGGGDPRPRRDQFALLASQRVYSEPYRDRRIHLTATVTRDEAVFVIRDEGRGFNSTQWLREGALADQETSSSRGLSLMRTIMDEVRYNSAGNEVTLVKRAIKPQPALDVKETAGHQFDLDDEEE